MKKLLDIYSMKMNESTGKIDVQFSKGKKIYSYNKFSLDFIDNNTQEKVELYSFLLNESTGNINLKFSKDGDIISYSKSSISIFKNGSTNT
ncbi:hypothetical protein HRF88_14895, partial [Enterococcus faecalis]|nr:hypothetical protein [Enterococcus faecalis]